MGQYPRSSRNRPGTVDQGELDRGYVLRLSETTQPARPRSLPDLYMPRHEGNKKDNVTVIYTPWSNLHKDGSMAVGQVGFKDQKKVRTLGCRGRQRL